MNITQLKVFATVVDTGSFTRAGDQLGITQSGVSHAISSYEQELGVSLLIRERGGISLTESGERVLKHVREILYRLDCIQDETESLSNLETGKVRIGSFPSASSRILPKILSSFQRKFPKIEVVLFEGTDQEILEWIMNRVVDVGFTTLPQVGLETIQIGKDRLFVILSEQHPLGQEEQIMIQNLIKEPFILSKGGCEPILQGIFKTKNVFPQVKYEVRDMETILAMVQEKIGWTIVPKMALPAQLNGINAIPLQPPVWRKVGLAVYSMDQCSHAVQAFIREAEELSLSK